MVNTSVHFYFSSYRQMYAQIQKHIKYYDDGDDYYVQLLL